MKKQGLTSEYKIAVIPGDGVGVEISKEAMRIAGKSADKHGHRLSADWFDWGCDYYLKNGAMFPPDMISTLAGYDAIYLGCIGDAAKVPDHVSLSLLLAIRKGFDQYVNLRPVCLYEGVPCPLKDVKPGDFDFIVVRENTEGEYSQVGGRFNPHTTDEVSIQTSIFTRKGTERIMRYAFQLAQDRQKLKGDATGCVGMVTNCSKSNALNYSMVFWDEVYKLVSADYPRIKQDFALVDALCMWFVKNPGHFDIVVASNLFGDIITDLGAMIQGGMGFAAGGNINPERTYPSMFEPIHGSAPKYAGKLIVNPIAAIEAGRMMLEHLGLDQAAASVGTAVKSVLAEGKTVTKDMGGTARTDQVGQAVFDRLE
ncbi:MAG: isocitrate/isopropylmalate family dehydrogenase [Spirochaetia bacterium]